MATATLTTDFTEITDCDSTTGWTGETVVSDTTTYIEGAGSVGFTIKTASDSHTQYFAPASAIDLSNTHVRMWFNTILKTRLKSFADGGIQIYISDGTNDGYWDVSGGDKYNGGWEILTVDTSKAPESGTQPTMTAITKIGINLKLAIAAVGTVSTTWIDWMVYGEKMYVYGGSSTDKINFDSIVSGDSYYGVIKKQNGVYFINSKLQLGDTAGTNDTYFSDNGKMVVWLDEVVKDTLYQLSVSGNSTGTTDIDIGGNFIASVSDDLKIDFTDDTNVSSINIDGSVIQNASDVLLSSIVDADGTVFDLCDLITPDDANLDNVVIKNGDSVSALKYTSVSDINNAIFTSSGTGHGVTIETSGTYTFNNFTFNGYAATDGTTGNEAFYNNSGDSITLNINGGTAPSVRNSTGSSTTLIVNPVSTTVTVKTNEAAPVAVENARVLVLAASGGDYPYDETVTISNSSTTATVTHTSHGMSTGDKVEILGASLQENNGVFSITVTDANTYTYTMSSAPGSSPTGTIKATYAALSGLTDSSGEITMSKSFNNNQPISGRVRKSSGTPYYIPANFVGTIDKSSGFSITVQLISDE